MFCMLVFVIFFLGSVAITGFSAKQAGGINGYARLVNGVGSDGRICGFAGVDGAGLMYSQQFTAFTSNGNINVCLKACPTQVGTVEATLLDSTTGNLVNASYATYPTTAHLTYCFPASGSSQSTVVQNSFNSQYFQRAVVDIGQTWQVILGGAFIALVFAFLFLGLLRHCGGCVVWLVLISLVVSLGAGGYFAWTESAIASNSQMQQTLKAVAIVAWVSDVVITLIIFAMRERIILATEVMAEATTAISAMKGMLLLPILKFFVMLCWMAVWTVGAVYIVSSGTTANSGSFTVPGVGVTIPMKSVNWSTTLQGMVAYHFFCLLWVSAFIVAVMQLTLAFAVASWYFTPAGSDGSKTVHEPVRAGLHATARFHLGTAAFGSLLIAVVEFVRAALEYVEKRTQAAGQETCLHKAVFCGCRCCLWCLEKCIRFINKQAYILTAIFGQGFCVSSKKAFGLVGRNMLRLGALNMVGGVFLKLGKAMICGGTTFVCYMFLRTYAVESPLVPCLVIAVLSYFTASIFMQVLSMTMDTILLCVIVDEEMNGRAQFASADIIKTLDDHQSARNAKEVKGSQL